MGTWELGKSELFEQNLSNYERVEWTNSLNYELIELQTSDGSGSKIFDPGWVNFLWLGSGRVSHLWFGLEFGKFPLKMSNFSIFFPSGQKNCFRLESTRVKAGSASYLLRVKSKLGSGQGPSLLQTRRMNKLVKRTNSFNQQTRQTNKLVKRDSGVVVAQPQSPTGKRLG